MIDGDMIAGAFISGVVGTVVSLFTIKYRHREDSKSELIGWYNKTIRLAERVKRVNQAERGVNSAVHAQKTSERVLNDMAGQIMNAPEDVEEEILDKAESFAESCQWASVYRLQHENSDGAVSNQWDPELQRRFSSAAESAEELRKETESAKKRV